MYSDEAKLVFGFEPSAAFEKVILAPPIGLPRTLLSEVADDADDADGTDDSDVALPASVLVGAGVVSFFGIFGSVTFGSEGNCPIAGSVKNDATAIAAISTNVDLIITIPPTFRSRFSVGYLRVSTILQHQDRYVCQKRPFARIVSYISSCYCQNPRSVHRFGHNPELTFVFQQTRSLLHKYRNLFLKPAV